MSRVPGMMYVSDFVSKGYHDSLAAALVRDYAVARNHYQSATAHAEVTVRSCVRRFLPVEVEDSDGAQRQCEFFARYCEPGHSLCYFRGEANLPDICRPLIEAASTLPPVA